MKCLETIRLEKSALIRKLDAFYAYKTLGYPSVASIYPQYLEFILQNRKKDYKAVEAEILQQLDKLTQARVF